MTRAVRKTEKVVPLRGRGQLTIPADWRRALGLKDESLMRVQLSGDTIIVRANEPSGRTARATKRKRPTRAQRAARERLLAGLPPLSDELLDDAERKAVSGRTGWVMTGAESDAAMREGRDGA